MKVPELYKSPSECCGCGACAAKCPVSAITIREDQYGFTFPKIDVSKCVGCLSCVNSCGLHAGLGQMSEGPWYAAVGKREIEESASGGVFVTLARSVLSNGGVAYGAAYVDVDGSLLVRHVRAASKSELSALQNSKYVQSDAMPSFPRVQEDLRRGIKVLYSGTPCQIAGLRGYLGREWDNLTTVDLVCHGVPSQSMFSGMVDIEERRAGAKLSDLRFRCKRDGWGHSLLLLQFSDGGSAFIPAIDFPYYDLFLNLKTLRESCYSCPYGGRYRAGDVTIGDFWGIEMQRPDVVTQEGFDLRRGISCILVNTSHGLQLIDAARDDIHLHPVAFEDIATGNDQLRHPSVRPADREMYLKAYSECGWPEVVRIWKRRERGARYRLKQVIRKIVPAKAIQAIRRVIRS